MEADARKGPHAQGRSVRLLFSGRPSAFFIKLAPTPRLHVVPGVHAAHDANGRHGVLDPRRGLDQLGRRLRLAHLLEHGELGGGRGGRHGLGAAAAVGHRCLGFGSRVFACAERCLEVPGGARRRERVASWGARPIGAVETRLMDDAFWGLFETKPRPPSHTVTFLRRVLLSTRSARCVASRRTPSTRRWRG